VLLLLFAVLLLYWIFKFLFSYPANQPQVWNKLSV